MYIYQKTFDSYYTAFKYWQSLKDKDKYVIEETETGCYIVVNDENEE